ncbi:MAG: hypothetical protein K8T90_20920 [Planctomycetes bacterium]|nr:hypothetical protein [Planctomycetota bacterium]
MRLRFRPNWAVLTALIVGATALLAQLPAVRRVLIWDDVYLFEASDLYTSPARFVEAVTSPLAKETIYWRPFATTSFLVESLVHGGVAEGFRATAALLFATCAALACLLLGRIVRRGDAATARPGSAGAAVETGWAVAVYAAMLFALHPVNVETATWIAARFDLLAGLLTLAVLLVATGTPDGASATRARRFAIGALTAAAAMSKEWAFLLPAFIPLVAAAVSNPAPGRAWQAVRVAKPLAMASAWGVGIVLLARTEVMSGAVFAARASDGAGALGSALLVGRSYLGSIGSILLPTSFVGPIHWGPRPVPAGDATGWVGLTLLAATVVATLLAWRRRPRIGLLLTAFLLAWLPTSQIVPITIGGPADTADRFQFLTSFLAVAILAEVVAARVAWRSEVVLSRWFRVPVLAGLIAMGAFSSSTRNRWNDEVRFWEWASDGAPKSVFARGHLARAALRAGDLERAENLARRNEDVDPTFLAEMLVRRERFAAARVVLDDAVGRGAGGRGALLLRGDVRARLGDAVGALGDFDAVVASDVGAAGRYESLAAVALAMGAEVLAATGETTRARSRVVQAADVAGSQDAAAWAAVTRTLRRLGDVEGAAVAAQKAAAAGAAPDDLIPYERR